MQGTNTHPSGEKWKWLKLLLKLLVTTACLWYVSRKIDFTSAAEALRNAHLPFLGLAILLFIISKIVSAYRLNIYFRNIGIILPEIQNIRLYWLGMFYNLFLPGSIGGDAYKVIRLTKLYGISYKKTTAAVIFDRISGIAGLGLLLGAISVLAFNDPLIPAILIPGAVLSVIILYYLTRKWFPYFIQGFFATLLGGLLVQVIQAVSVTCIMIALGLPAIHPEYLFVFLVSSVVSILPLTIGGLGIREIVFLQGAAYFGLQEEKAILISLLFYLVTLVTSAIGAFYVFRDPLYTDPKKKDSSLSP